VERQWFKLESPPPESRVVRNCRAKVAGRICDLMVRVSGARVRFPALPDFLRRSGTGTGSTQLHEYN
jgi:hypothetical protein